MGDGGSERAGTTDSEYTRSMSLSRSITFEERLTVPAAAFDHAGYRAWVASNAYPAGVRTTFLQGEVLVEMSPESLETHNQVKLAVTLGIGAFARERDLGIVYPDGALVTNEEAALSTEPDLTFVSWASFDQGRVRLQPRAGGTDFVEIVGSPDLVVEVVSDASVKKDTERLRDVYARAGVLEYWLIDARGPGIRFEILANAGGQFVSPHDPSAPRTSGVLGGRWTLTRRTDRPGRSSFSLDRID
jgi:Uma2 family endonuclease